MYFPAVSSLLTLLLLPITSLALRPYSGHEVITTLNSLSLVYIDLSYLIPTPTSLIEGWKHITDVEFAFENGTYGAVPWKPYNHSSQYDIQAAHHTLILEETRFLRALAKAADCFNADQSREVFALANQQYEVSFNFYNVTYFIGPDMFSILAMDEARVINTLWETRQTFLANFGK